MLALSQRKALLKEHNFYRCYINKDEALLFEKGIITPTDLLQLKDETKTQFLLGHKRMQSSCQISC